jgi:hypothetical protein
MTLLSSEDRSGLCDQGRRNGQDFEMLSRALIASRVPTAVACRAVIERATARNTPHNLRHKRPEVIPNSSNGKAVPISESSFSQSADWQTHHQHALQDLWSNWNPYPGLMRGNCLPSYLT